MGRCKDPAAGADSKRSIWCVREILVVRLEFTIGSPAGFSTPWSAWWSGILAADRFSLSKRRLPFAADLVDLPGTCSV